MTAIYLPPRLARVLRDIGTTSRAELVARAADLEALGTARRRHDAPQTRDRTAAPHRRPTPSPQDDPAAGLPKILTTTEAADFRRVSRRAVANWCAAGNISAYRLGADWRIPRSEIRRLLIPDTATNPDQPIDQSATAPR